MGTNSRLNRIYRQMKQRCYNPRHISYKNYGAKGITICDEWKDAEKVPLKDNASRGFLAFKSWALNNGYTDNLTIDRIDYTKGYCPNNCRWVTYKVQCNNTKRNHIITYKGETKTMAQWSEKLGIKYGVLAHRINTYGWSIKKAFETY